MAKQSSRQDLYTRVTNQIVLQLEHGVRPWMKPWSVEHIAGRITRPLRHNAIPYRGVNVLLLWSEALTKGYAAPLWMTYKQSREMGAQIRKGEHGSLVVYADRITKTETNGNGQDVEREIPFMKGYTVFNVEQIDGFPAHYYAQPVTPLSLSLRPSRAR
jgi:antirestriction protein ArdC